MRDFEKFKGIFPALYACYDDEGNVSPERTKALVNYYYDKGVRGLYITGSSGECIYQNKDERKVAMKAVMEAAKGRMVVIAHVAAACTRDSVELAAYAKELGVDAIASIPPIYFAFPEYAIESYWNKMIDAAQLPFFIYNIPQTTGFNMSQGLFKKMLENPLVYGVKNTSMPVFDIQQFKSCGGNNCVVFNGPDEQLAGGLMLGADGGIGGTYGVMPELFLAIYDAMKDGNLERAKAIQFDVSNIIKELTTMHGHMLSVIKEILRMRGMEIGQAREPLAPVSEEDKPRIVAVEKTINETIAKYCK